MNQGKKLPPEGSPEREQLRRVASKITELLFDDSRIIQGGWLGFAQIAVPVDASAAQVSDMRMSFYGGAQHLFSSIMNVMEKGDEATENDMRRIANIAAELAAFEKAFRALHDIE